MSQKPSLPKGTRDFGPAQMLKRQFIFDAIRQVFQKYGFLPLETPAMENIEVLTGKYGEEGEQLIFKILNSKLYEAKNKEELLKTFELSLQKNTHAQVLTEKALRYDLTIPFARYVVMNRNEITFPFKRYQMQPVWRGDKPQKGRYREFYQCDADVIGTSSLLCEAEIVLMLNEVFEKLGLADFVIKINNRKILSAITEKLGMPGRETDFCVAIDKLDKIGKDKVLEELEAKGFSAEALKLASPILELEGLWDEKISFLEKFLEGSALGSTGIKELQTITGLLTQMGLKQSHLELDITLARGLTYYTGAIFEVKATKVQMGSICGGGRYDNLTGSFGLPDVSGVGISFGIDRIYDVMEELNLFPTTQRAVTKVLIAFMDEKSQHYSLPLLYQLRANHINSELFPEVKKIAKQMDYADKKGIPYVIIIGEEEMNTGRLTLKNMKTGLQQRLEFKEILTILDKE